MGCAENPSWKLGKEGRLTQRSQVTQAGTIQDWRFRPVEVPEGKPLAVRTHIQAEVVLYPVN